MAPQIPPLHPPPTSQVLSGTNSLVKRETLELDEQGLNSGSATS